MSERKRLGIETPSGFLACDACTAKPIYQRLAESEAAFGDKCEAVRIGDKRADEKCDFCDKVLMRKENQVGGDFLPGDMRHKDDGFVRGKTYRRQGWGQ